ncbi:hypothetical protein FOA43_000055 [Brettanomyces nanus]|uniref:Uncharacterized protein n=1 Tax=Eeniella nana TaxID=13502 RepID=A0A875RZW0_EENNA|nr:uncharacterized protein FOA43_000055 [Brettanomyces nanus]QPG72754.1 hypothetical protein FOA43_000055 [Brettanomyces nanus]
MARSFISTEIDWQGLSQQIASVPKILKRINCDSSVTKDIENDQLDQFFEDIRRISNLFILLQDSVLRHCKAVTSFMQHSLKLYQIFKEILESNVDFRKAQDRLSEILIIRLDGVIHEASTEIESFQLQFKDTMSKILKLLKLVNKNLKRREYLILDITCFKQDLAKLNKKKLLTTSEHEKKFVLDQDLQNSLSMLTGMNELLNAEIPSFKKGLHVIASDLTVIIIFFHMRLHFHLYNLTKDVIEIKEVKELFASRIIAVFRDHHQPVKEVVNSLMLLTNINRINQFS